MTIDKGSPMHRYREHKGKTARRALAAIALGLISAAGASGAPSGGDASMASPDASSLLGVQRELAFDVSRYQAPDGKRWIRFASTYETAYRAGVEDIVATLWDFENSPKAFSRILSSRVRSDSGTEAVTEQRTGVRVLGFSYLSDLVFRDVLTRPGPSSAIMEFEAIEVDATTLSARGSWTLEQGSDAAGPLTYARYTMESYVEPRIIAQEMIMRSFGGADMRKLLRELGAATAKRIKAGQGRASSPLSAQLTVGP
jgi:hypothetical protein